MLRIGGFELIIACLSSRDSDTIRSALSILVRLAMIGINIFIKKLRVLADKPVVREAVVPVLRCLTLPDIRIKKSALKIIMVMCEDGNQ